MQYPFNTQEQYFRRDEEKALQAFLAEEPQPGLIYSAEGEDREVIRVILPTGAVTKETIYTPLLANGTRQYHTPRATLAGERGARVLYVDKQTGGMYNVPQDEWMAFVKSGFVTTEKPPQEENPAEVLGRQAERNRLQSAHQHEEEEKKVEKRKAQRAKNK